MELLSYFIGGVFLLFGTLIVLASYVRQVTNFRNRDKQSGRWSSPVPFIGPVLIIVGYSALPIEFSKWVFLVIVLDPNTVFTVLSIPYLIKGLRE